MEKHRNVVKTVEGNGFVYERETRHGDRYMDPKTGDRVIIPAHDRINPHTAKRIIAKTMKRR